MSICMPSNARAISVAWASVTFGSMVGPFPSGVCENTQCKGRGLAAHSMDNTGVSLRLLHPRLIVLDAEAPKDLHHRPFAGGIKRAKGYVLGLRQQVLGLGHFLLHVFNAASLRGPACNCTQLFLNKVVST